MARARERCSFGRLWTPEGDKLILEPKEQGISSREIGRRLAERLDRTPRAIRTHLQKLTKKGRREGATTPEAGLEKRGHKAASEPSSPPAVLHQATSLLSASLSLTEDPKHLPAIRILLSQALQLLRRQAGEAVNKNS